MPSIPTIIADLANGTVVGLGALPSSDAATETPLSGPHACKYFYNETTYSISGSNRLTGTHGGATPNGRFLCFQDNHATVCQMDANRPLVVSNFFSGCAFKVYKHGNIYYATHIARPGGPGSEANVKMMDDYATQKGWTEMQDVRSAGVIGVGGATTVAMVCRLGGGNIDTVRLGLNGMGVAVATHRVTSPA